MSEDIGWGDSWVEIVRRRRITPPEARTLADLEEHYDRLSARRKAIEDWIENGLQVESERSDHKVQQTFGPAEVVTLETGEKRVGVNTSCRIFFVYVTPTGAEMPITRCPSLSKIVSRSSGGFEGDTRVVVTDYRVHSPTTLKMVNIVSKFGEPRRVINLFLHLSVDEAMIAMFGLDRFGRFKGRAKIDLEYSTYRDPVQTLPVTMDMLKSEFGLVLVSAGTKSSAGRSRSLMFD